MQKENQYYCFNENGEAKMPSKEDVSISISKGIKPVVFLDSCVCLDIIKTVDYKNKATQVNKSKVINFKNYISESQIHISPLFGLMELCFKAGKFDEDKFWDFKNKIDFFERIPKSHFKGFKYDYNRDYLITSRPHLQKPSPYYGLETPFLHTYASLLKIRELASGGLSKNKAEKNCYDLYNWMINELGIMLGFEYNLGINIFGGATNFRKMIGIDGDNNLTKKKLIGTAWDIIHSRFCSNNISLSNFLNEPVSAYFLTDDKNLYTLLSKFNLNLVLNHNNENGVITMFNSDNDCPHLDQAFFESLNQLMVTRLFNRINKPSKYDVEKVKVIIVDLEKRNNINF